MAYTREQLRHLRLAQTVGAQVGATRAEEKAAIEAMLVESGARNVGYGDRDSVGILQQRPSQGWNHASDPAGALKDFYAHARQLRGQGLKPGELAQAVQRSAFPARYGQRAGEADALLTGSPAPSRRVGPAAAAAAAADPSARQALLLSYLQDRDRPDALLNLAAGLQELPAAAAPAYKAPKQPTKPAAGGGGKILELFYDPAGFKSPGNDHGDHVHAGFDSPEAVRAAAELARSMGLDVRENDAYEPVDPVHSKNSLHYQRFPGTKLDKAIDVVGPPQKLSRYAKTIARRYGR